MGLKTEIAFPPFRLDVANEQLWREKELIPLRPKTFAILRYLVEHTGLLVTKDELLHAVWGEIQVSDEGLQNYMCEIRQALGNDSTSPRFVETVCGRGYRFIAKVVNSQQSAVSSQEQSSVQTSLGSSVQRLESEAEEYFLKAIEIACKQSAKSLELRAVMSVSRLWQQQGKKEEARQMLAEIYGWFTEGFDTKDLQEAKVLLEELT